MRSRRAVVVAFALVALTSAAAIAAWTGGGTGSAFTKADDLGQPTGFTATAGVNSVALTWSAPSGLAPTSYTLSRSGGGSMAGCTSSITTTGCTDTGVTAGTSYTYTLVAVRGAWTSAPVQATASPTAAPSLTLNPNHATAGGSVDGAVGGFPINTSLAFALDTMTGTAITATSPTTGASGTWSGTLTLPGGASAGAHTIWVRGGAPLTTASASFTIDASPTTTTSFTVAPSTSTPTAGTAFTLTVTAKNTVGSTTTTDATYTGTHALTVSGANASRGGNQPTYPTNGSFINGVATVSVTLFNAETATLTVTDGAGHTGQASVTVSPKTTPTLSFTSCAVNGGSTGSCAASIAVGNGGHVTGKVTIVGDQYGNGLLAANVSLSITVSSDDSQFVVTGSPVTVTGTATQSGSFTVTYNSSGNASAAVTASATGYTSATITVRK